MRKNCILLNVYNFYSTYNHRLNIKLVYNLWYNKIVYDYLKVPIKFQNRLVSNVMQISNNHYDIIKMFSSTALSSTENLNNSML